MDRALRGVAVGLAAMFVFLAWGILTTPASLLVKLVLFFLLTASAFGVTLVMTTESPVADAVLKAPWEEPAAGDREEPDGDRAEPAEAEAPARPRERVAARSAAGRAPRARRARAAEGASQAEGAQGQPAGGQGA